MCHCIMRKVKSHPVQCVLLEERTNTDFCVSAAYCVCQRRVNLWWWCMAPLSLWLRRWSAMSPWAWRRTCGASESSATSCESVWQRSAPGAAATVHKCKRWAHVYNIIIIIIHGLSFQAETSQCNFFSTLGKETLRYVFTLIWSSLLLFSLVSI